MVKNKNLLLLFLTFIVVISFSDVAFARNSKNDISGIDVKLEGGGLNLGTAQNTKDSWSTILEKYQGFIKGAAAIAVITLVAAFIVQFVKLANTSDNAMARKQILTGLMWTGVATAGVGAIALVVGIFYNLADK